MLLGAACAARHKHGALSDSNGEDVAGKMALHSGLVAAPCSALSSVAIIGAVHEAVFWDSLSDPKFVCELDICLSSDPSYITHPNLNSKHRSIGSDRLLAFLSHRSGKE